jgi:hypothetical protein
MARVVWQSTMARWRLVALLRRWAIVVLPAAVRARG